MKLAIFIILFSTLTLIPSVSQAENNIICRPKSNSAYGITSEPPFKNSINRVSFYFKKGTRFICYSGKLKLEGVGTGDTEFVNTRVVGMTEKQAIAALKRQRPNSIYTDRSVSKSSNGITSVEYTSGLYAYIFYLNHQGIVTQMLIEDSGP